MAPPLACEHCDRTFTKRYSLNRHLHSIHHMEPMKMPRKAIVCPISNCNDTFAYHGPLRSHLKSAHDIQLQGQKLTFTSMKDFFEWKEKEEMKFFVKYVKACGVQRLLDHTEVYRFNCHRTGTYIPEGKGLRKLKSTGSCKIGASCPSTITAHRHPNDSVTCTYCLTHVGHETTQAQAPFFPEPEDPPPNPVPNPAPNSQVIKIIYPSAFTSIIAANVPDSTDIVSIVPKLTSTLVQNHEMFNLFRFSDEDQVVLSIVLGQDKLAEETLEAIRSTTKKASVENFTELTNKLKVLEESDFLHGMEVPPNMEVFLGKLLANAEENPVLFYEHIVQRIDETGADLGRINFVIMNSLQSWLLHTYGNGGVVCVDAVHGTFGGVQDYVLLAILVWNMSQGWSLCGLCVFAEITEDSLSAIFAHIRNRTGPIVPKVLFGDHRDCTLRAWERTMGRCDVYLVGSWHLDMASQALLVKGHTDGHTDNVKMACTYKLLLRVLESEDEGKFEELVGLVETALAESDDNEEVRTFFNDNYVEKRNQWAKYARLDDVNKAANLMEPIHYLLEHVCRGYGEKFSQALCILLIFFRKHAFDGIDAQHLEQTALVDLGANEHEASLQLSGSSVSCLAGQRWIVDDGCQKHQLRQEDSGCSCHHDSVLMTCDICLHSFTCSCINSAVCWKVCRHVHLLSRQVQGECLMEDLLNWDDDEVAPAMDNPPENPETEVPLDQEDRAKLLEELQECGRKILENAKLLAGKRDLTKLRDSMFNTLNLSKSLIGPHEPTREQGIQCNMGTEMDFFSLRLKSYSDHDYTSLS